MITPIAKGLEQFFFLGGGSFHRCSQLLSSSVVKFIAPPKQLFQDDYIVYTVWLSAFNQQVTHVVPSEQGDH